MPDMEQLNDIRMIAQVISSLPPQQPGGPRIPLAPPKVTQWAAELYSDFGVRVHPELARKDVAGGESELGNFTSKQVVDRVDAEHLLGLLKTSGVPSLVVLAERIEAAETDEQKRLVLADIAREYPDVVRTAVQIAEETPPEAYEQ